MRRLLVPVLVWAALLGMAPNLRAAVCVAGQPSTAGNAASSAVTSLTLTNPGSQVGDVLLVQLVLGTDSSCPVAGCAPPSGWTIYSTDRRGDKIQTLLYHVAGASEPSSYTFSFGSARAVGGLLMLRGVNIPGSGNPIAQVRSNTGRSATLTALSVNVASGNSLVVRSFAWDNGNDVLSGPTTQHYTMATGAGPNGVAASASSAERLTPGPSGDATATAEGSVGNWLAVTTVLAPGSGGGGICGLSQVDHYELLYPSNQTLTCNPLAVTVRACANSSCSTLYGSPTTTTLSARNALGSPVGNWSSNPLTFTGSASRSYQLTTAGFATLGISSASPTASNPLQCVVGGVSGDNCTVAFADSGFILDVPNLLAAKPMAATIQAVKKSDSSQKCVPGFASGTRSVQFSRSYADPGTGSQPVLVNATAVTNATPVTLNFDATATAALDVRYDDAGQMNLSASYTGSGLESGLVMVGDDDFVSKPYGLLLQTDTDSGCTANINCLLYPGGVRAGDPFNLRIKAVAWQSDGEPLTAAALANNLVTPNFRLGNIALRSQVQAPSSGDNGALGLPSYDHALGNQTVLANQSISEVGVFTLTAAPVAGSYLDGETVSGGESGLVGRFAPAYLEVTRTASTMLTPSCANPDPLSSFSYQGQPIGFTAGQEPSLVIAGHNRQGAITTNYDQGTFWRLTNAPERSAYTSVTGVASLDQVEVAGPPLVLARLQESGTTQSAYLVDSSVGDGALTARWSDQQLWYSPAVVPTADDLPFPALVSLNVPADELKDADSVCYTHGVTTSGAACENYFSDADPSADRGPGFGGTAVRLGRLYIGNAHGSELQPLDLPVRLESWQTNPVPATGSSFQLEGLDTCTANALGMPALTGHTGKLTSGNYGNDKVSLVALAGGQGVLRLQAPGRDGSVQAYFQEPPALTWLYYDWRGLGREPAKGLATFGIYKGAAPLIFRRELYR